MTKDFEADVFPSRFSLAIVEPEFPLNVGYISRTMANFGLKQLYIVSEKGTRSRFDYLEAIKFASHGDYIVSKSKQVYDLAHLRNKFAILVGTTAIRGKRKSNLTRKTLSLSDAVPMIARSLDEKLRNVSSGLSKVSLKKNACFVFGRDTTGLTNEELRKCDYTITISTGTKYNTLNISHAAAILLYSFSDYYRNRRVKNVKAAADQGMVEENSSRIEKERTILLFQELAKVSDFQDYKKDKLREAMTRLLDRSNISLRELYLLMGLASKARRKIDLLSK